MATAECSTCGAPDNGESVHCFFCKNPINAELLQGAIPCPNPQCRSVSRWGKQKCGSCQAWLVVTCVFCGSLSPHNLSNCMQCHEAFQGAAQRKAMREQQANQYVQHNQNVQVASIGLGVAAGLLGGFASGGFDDDIF